MKINIKPEIRTANELQSIIMETYDYPCLYVVEAPNGWQYTVEFTPEKLKDFLPNETVSGFLKSGEKAIKRSYDFYLKGIKTKAHPRFKRRVHNEDGTIDYFPIELSESDIKYHWKPKLEIEKAKLGKLKFIKIV